MENNVFFYIRFIVALVFYFIPFIVVLTNKHHNNQMGLFISNLCFGWTIIGWIICLIWAFKDRNIKEKK